MRKISGAASLAALALAAVGLQTAGGQALAQPARPGAVDTLRQHPAAALASKGTGFTVTDRVTDPSGATHVRMDRTYRGLPVLGGDLVVHQGSAGALASPFCRSSKEMLSGERTKAMWPSRGGRLMVTPLSIRRWQVA